MSDRLIDAVSDFLDLMGTEHDDDRLDYFSAQVDRRAHMALLDALREHNEHACSYGVHHPDYDAIREVAQWLVAEGQHPETDWSLIDEYEERFRDLLTPSAVLDMLDLIEEEQSC